MNFAKSRCGDIRVAEQRSMLVTTMLNCIILSFLLVYLGILIRENFRKELMQNPIISIKKIILLENQKPFSTERAWLINSSLSLFYYPSSIFLFKRKRCGENYKIAM